MVDTESHLAEGASAMDDRAPIMCTRKGVWLDIPTGEGRWCSGELHVIARATQGGSGVVACVRQQLRAATLFMQNMGSIVQ